MSSNAVAQVLLFLLAVTVFAVPLGAYIARVFSGEATIAQRVFGPVERAMYKLAGVREDEEMPWQRYAAALLVFNLGYGAALSWVLFALVGGLALLSFWSSKYWVFYAGEKDKK